MEGRERIVQRMDTDGKVIKQVEGRKGHCISDGGKARGLYKGWREGRGLYKGWTPMGRLFNRWRGGKGIV